MRRLGTPDGQRVTGRPSGVVTVVALGTDSSRWDSRPPYRRRRARRGVAPPTPGFPSRSQVRRVDEYVAPTETRDQGQLNQPLGERAAAEIAREIGLKKSDVLTPAQYHAFVAGGVNPVPAILPERSWSTRASRS